MAISYEITNDADGIVAWILNDGNKFIRQPHHPDAFNFEPWKSVEEATVWAQSYIVEYQNQEQLLNAELEKAEEDRQRLIRIESMLQQIVNNS